MLQGRYSALSPTEIMQSLVALLVSALFSCCPTAFLSWPRSNWPDPVPKTKFGLIMGPEVGHGAAEVYAGVQA